MEKHVFLLQNIVRKNVYINYKVKVEDFMTKEGGKEHPEIAVLARALRSKLNISQEELAERAKISQPAIARLETKGIIGKKTAEKLAKIFNIPPSRLTFEQKENELPIDIIQNLIKIP